MKLKTVLSTVLLAVAALLLAACGNSKADAEKARQDSIARADSIAKVKAAAEAAAEAARLDSLRQDSIAKVKDFEAKIPSFTRLYEKDNLDFLKGLGFTKKVTGKDPYAVLQLRRDNANGTLYNLVGCQTHLKFGEQKRVFSLIPALKNAEFVRYGVMHRNTFLDSPRLLDATYALKSDPRIRFAGQMTGVEGYVESTASGWVAGVATAMDVLGKPMPALDRLTATGALATYMSDHTVAKFQPMNVNFCIIEPLGYKIKGKREKNTKISERALEQIEKLKGEL